MPQKIKREGHKQDKKEPKMVIKKEKDLNAKKDWTNIYLLIDMLEEDHCSWDMYHFDYINHGIRDSIHGDTDIIGHKYSLNKK